MARNIPKEKSQSKDPCARFEEGTEAYVMCNLRQKMQSDPLYHALRNRPTNAPGPIGPYGPGEADYFSPEAEWARLKGIGINPMSGKIVGPLPGEVRGKMTKDYSEEASMDISRLKGGPTPLADVKKAEMKQKIMESPSYRSGIREAITKDESLYDLLGESEGIEEEEELRRRRSKRLGGQQTSQYGARSSGSYFNPDDFLIG